MWKSILKFFGWNHKWEYRNPYDRTCTRCGEHQVEECDWIPGTDQWQSYRMNRNPEWAVYREGNGSCD